jgi:hypothetical protein
VTVSLGARTTKSHTHSHFEMLLGIDMRTFTRTHLQLYIVQFSSVCECTCYLLLSESSMLRWLAHLRIHLHTMSQVRDRNIVLFTRNQIQMLRIDMRLNAEAREEIKYDKSSNNIRKTVYPSTTLIAKQQTQHFTNRGPGLPAHAVH